MCPLKWNPAGSGRQDTSECDERATPYGCAYPFCQQRGNMGCNSVARREEASKAAEAALQSITGPTHATP